MQQAMVVLNLQSRRYTISHWKSAEL